MQVNPMQLITMIKNGNNPQQLIMSLLEDSMPNNPIAQNVMELAKNGRGADIEKIARNLCAQRGIDFDTEFNSFKNHLGL